MTIGIGALATDDRFKPDTLVMTCDTMGSYGDTHSTDAVHKLFSFPEDKLYIVAANDINKACELVPILQAGVGKLDRREHGSLFHALHEAAWGYHRGRAHYEILPKYQIPREDWASHWLSMSQSDRESITQEMLLLDVGFQLLVGTFADTGQALLYYLSGRPYVVSDNDQVLASYAQPCPLPGFHAIGSGANNAEFWLGFRNYSLSFSPKRAAYHLYEAHIMARKSGFVNSNVELLIASREEQVLLTEKNPRSEDWSLEEFAQLYGKYGPQRTESLGIAPGVSERRDKLFQ